LDTVLYLINQYPSPSHTFIRREIASLERLGHTVVRFALRGWDKQVVEAADILEIGRTHYVLQRGAIPLLLCALQTAVGHPIRFTKALAFCLRRMGRSNRPAALHLVYLLESAWIAREAKRKGVSHIHAHFGTNAAELALLVRKLVNISYSFTVHGPEEFDHPEQLALKEKVQMASFVVAISHFTRSQLCRWIDYEDWDKIQIIRCGIDARYLEQPLSTAPRTKMFVCIARLAPQKGQLALIEAIALARLRRPDIQLRLIGDGDMRPAIEQRIEALGLAENITLLGWASEDDVHKELLDSRALVLPSFAEGLPMVLMEALALERPVLTTYVAGIPELVRDGMEGWLFPAGSAEATADALVACLDAGSDQMEEMGRRGRARVLDMHQSDENARLLSRAIAGRQGSTR
jgi:glycosyltransferase involved in cell wall biosynthesis